MSSHVDFVFSKNWGLTKKGTVKNLDRALARNLQDIRKVGKIQKPAQDKTDKTVLSKK